MAFDEGLAERIREVLREVAGTRADITEKRMFGGIAFMSGGYMFIGIAGDVLMARVGPDAYLEALRRTHVREMDFTGRPMKGYVFVDPPGFEDDRALERWVRECRAFVQSLPAKSAPPAKSARQLKPARPGTPTTARPRARAGRPAKKAGK